MGLISLLNRWFTPKRTWTVIILHDDTEYVATASDENAEGMWHVTFQEYGKPYPTTKWIEPTDAQKEGRRTQGE